MKRRFDPLANIAMAKGDGEDVTEKDFADFRRHEANLAEGLCPNGCGPMTWEDDQFGYCSICKFVMSIQPLYVGPE